MKKLFLFSILAACVLWMGGCALTAEQKSNLEKTLRQEVESFIDNSVQSHWDTVYGLTNGALGSPNKLKENLRKSLPEDGVLTGGEITSMAWEDDKTAKVKINWAFRQGGALGFSSETFVWTLKGTTWQYQGRALR